MIRNPVESSIRGGLGGGQSHLAFPRPPNNKGREAVNQIPYEPTSNARLPRPAKRNLVARRRPSG
jgi:hypothetical protein